MNANLSRCLALDVSSLRINSNFSWQISPPCTISNPFRYVLETLGLITPLALPLRPSFEFVGDGLLRISHRAGMSGNVANEGIFGIGMYDPLAPVTAKYLKTLRLCLNLVKKTDGYHDKCLRLALSRAFPLEEVALSFYGMPHTLSVN